MTINQDSANTLLQEARRLLLEHSFAQAEGYLQARLASRPNDREALSALAVLLLESGQYSRANHITRRLTALLGSGEEEIPPSRTEAGSEVGLQTIDEEGDIAKDLALSRIFAEREGLTSISTQRIDSWLLLLGLGLRGSSVSSMRAH